MDATGFEPATSRLGTGCSTRIRTIRPSTPPPFYPIRWERGGVPSHLYNPPRNNSSAGNASERTRIHSSVLRTS